MTDSLDQRRKDAQNPDSDPERLTALGQDSDSSVRRHVAKNLWCPQPTLTLLAKDEEWMVRDAVVTHPYCPPDVLHEMASNEDERWSIRANIARHQKTLPETLALLAASGDPRIQEVVVQNISVPDDAMRGLAQSPRKSIRLMAATNPRCDPEVLNMLSGDSDPDVKRAVFNNPSCPESVKIIYKLS